MGDILGPGNDPPDLGESVGYSDRFEVRRHPGHGDPVGTGEPLTAHYTERDAQRQLDRLADVVTARGGQATVDELRLLVVEADGTHHSYSIHRS